MENKYFVLTATSILIGAILLFWLIIYCIIATDLKNEVVKLKEENQELRWENENNYMYCEEE
jgi:hypothetical protein